MYIIWFNILKKITIEWISFYSLYIKRQTNIIIK